MNRKWPFAASILAFAAFAAAISFDVNNALLTSHADKLKQAGSLTISFTVNRIGSELEEHKLVLSKPGMIRWESPSAVMIANGTSLISLDKKTNQYTEEPQTADAVKKLLSNEVLWTWSAFADDTFMKPITDARTGAARKVKGVAVKEVAVSRGVKVTTLFVDDQLGFARGATYQDEKGGQKGTVLILASEIALGKDSLPATDKQFAVPSGAQKVEKSALALAWKDVAPIFSARCGCHVSRPTAGLSLSNHKGIMAG
ncbi:MAG: hypothetical protein H7Y17_07260, partial [Chlorobia bacterium]|nr:hypothetical protein [Fimbriimonadaceae bacterium]